jgi:hypothetical protein
MIKSLNDNLSSFIFIFDKNTDRPDQIPNNTFFVVRTLNDLFSFLDIKKKYKYSHLKPINGDIPHMNVIEIKKNKNTNTYNDNTFDHELRDEIEKLETGDYIKINLNESNI